MTYACSPCGVNWAPYQARDGACPMCGGGTTRSHDAPTDPRRLRVGDAIAPDAVVAAPDTAAALLRIWEREGRDQAAGGGRGAA